MDGTWLRYAREYQQTERELFESSQQSAGINFEKCPAHVCAGTRPHLRRDSPTCLPGLGPHLHRDSRRSVFVVPTYLAPKGMVTPMGSPVPLTHTGYYEYSQGYYEYSRGVPIRRYDDIPVEATGNPPPPPGIETFADVVRPDPRTPAVGPRCGAPRSPRTPRLRRMCARTFCRRSSCTVVVRARCGMCQPIYAHREGEREGKHLVAASLACFPRIAVLCVGFAFGARSSSFRTFPV